MSGRERARSVFTVAGWIWLAARTAASQELSTYQEMRAVAGDDHRHGGSVESHLLLSAAPGGASFCTASFPHETGLAVGIYRAQRNARYDFVNLAYHDFALVDRPLVVAPGPARIDPLHGYCTPRFALGLPDFRVGYPDYWLRADPGSPASPLYCAPEFQYTAVDPPWNEALSHSTAAAAASEPGAFAAFSGREYTPQLLRHTLAIPPGDTDRVCGASREPGPDRCADETDLYRWILRTRTSESANPGVLIRAHPRDGYEGDGVTDPAVPVTPWNPFGTSAERSGFSDTWIQGIEIGNYAEPVAWESAYRHVLAEGYRLFPSFGSDLHRLHSGIETVPGQACWGDEVPRLEHGAVVCWVDASAAPWQRQSVIDAMHARRCYYSVSAKPQVEIEACALDASGACSGAPVQMGARLTAPDHDVRIRVVAVNDPLNQTSANRRAVRASRAGGAGRLGRLPARIRPPRRRIAFSATRRRPTAATLAADLDVVAGAVYARICSTPVCADDDGLNTVVVSAPVFVNWDVYTGQMHAQGRRGPLDESFDADGDQRPYLEDNCPLVANPDQSDTDGDEIGDVCDTCAEIVDPDQADLDGDDLGDPCDGDIDGDGIANAEDGCPLIFSPHNEDGDADGVADVCDVCPRIADPGQSDADGDGHGDACDNCVHASNPAVDAAFEGETTTGGQLDDDADGFGNVCDGDFDQNLRVDYVDILSLELALFAEKLRVEVDCALVDDRGLATEVVVACDVLDSNGDGLLTFADQSHPPALLAASEKCADCGVRFDLLPCQGDACGPDGDGVPDALDNCPANPNPAQEDGDGDGLGDACDACPTDAANDADQDSICGDVDACPADPANDADGDGVCGDADNCPTARERRSGERRRRRARRTPAIRARPTRRTTRTATASARPPTTARRSRTPTRPNDDGDGIGDACDACPSEAPNDADGDGRLRRCDNCPPDREHRPGRRGRRRPRRRVRRLPARRAERRGRRRRVRERGRLPADREPGSGGRRRRRRSAMPATPVSATRRTTPTPTASAAPRTSAPRFPMPARPTPTGTAAGTRATTAPRSRTRISQTSTATARATPATRAPPTPRTTRTETESAAMSTTARASPTRIRWTATATGSAIPATSAWRTPETTSTGTACAALPTTAWPWRIPIRRTPTATASATRAICACRWRDPAQSDADGDALGDACDVCPADAANDADADGACGDADLCPQHADPDQGDADGDGRGDVCDDCPAVVDPAQADVDGDGLGDACDACPEDAANDVDGDGVCLPADNCGRTANAAQSDVGGLGGLTPDGVGDVCQCGDVSDDGIVDPRDVLARARVALGSGVRGLRRAREVPRERARRRLRRRRARSWTWRS